MRTIRPLCRVYAAGLKQMTVALGIDAVNNSIPRYNDFYESALTYNEELVRSSAALTRLGDKQLWL